MDWKGFCADPGVADEILRSLTVMGFEDENELLDWISSAPTVSTVRVNTLRFTLEEALLRLKEFLIKQCALREYGSAPKVNILDKDKAVLQVECSKLRISPCESKGTIIVDMFCGAAVLRGADIFVSGIIGMSSHLSAGDWATVLVDVEGKCRKGADSSLYVSEQLVRIGFGRCLYSRKEIFKSPPVGPGVLMLSVPHPSFNVPSEMEGDFFLQNYPSTVAVYALLLKKGHSLLDMCAAPGGKTLVAGMVLSNEGSILAVDKSKKKIESVQNNCGKYGISIVDTLVCDGRKLPEVLKDDKGNPKLFDRVLVDAPCSALGKRTLFRIRSSLKELLSYPKLQKDLLVSGIKLLKPGGYLVYSTCTLTLSENEDIVKWVLNKYKDDIKLDDKNPVLGEKGYKRFSDFAYIGFFVAVFYKAR